MPGEVEPTVRGAPLALTPLAEGLSPITEYTAHGSQPRRPGAGADAELDRVEPVELRQIPVDHGGGQGRHRARPTDHRHAPSARKRIETLDPGDELPSVGEVDVMTTRLDRGHRNGVTL